MLHLSYLPLQVVAMEWARSSGAAIAVTSTNTYQSIRAGTGSSNIIGNM